MELIYTDLDPEDGAKGSDGVLQEGPMIFVNWILDSGFRRMRNLLDWRAPSQGGSLMCGTTLVVLHKPFN